MPTISQYFTLPDEDYPYFEQWSEHPFQAQTDKFSRVNAWHLAEASMLAYGNRAFVENKLAEKNIHSQVDFVSKASTQCLLLTFKDFVIIAFRGTEFPNPEPARLAAQYTSMLADVIADVKIKPVDFEEKGKVHQGFRDAFFDVCDELDDKITELSPRHVWFTGHSMGGALATLASVYFQPNHGLRGVYTFGSPMVGDAKFAQFGQRDHYRFVNNNDFVANLLIPNVVFPFVSRNYVHCGQEMRFDHRGTLLDTPGQAGIFDRFSGWIQQPFTAIGNFFFKRELTLPIDAFNDHVPRFYAENTKRQRA